MTATTPAPTALAEPTVKVSGVFLATIALANLGIMIAFFTPIQNLLPRYATAVAGEDGKEVALAVITGVGVLGSVIFNPLAGAFSDRTTSRFGRRRPWLLGGAVVGALMIALLTVQSTVIGLTITWFLAQACVNAAYAGLTATIPDQVPVNQRAIASGWVGFAQTLGVVLGVGLVTFIVTALAGGTLLTSALLILLVLPFLAILKDPPLRVEDREPFVMGTFLRGFWVSPRRHPDFAWAWLARFLVSLATAMATLYLLFFLQDVLGFSEKEAGERQTVLLGLYSFGTMATAVLGGYLSDRNGKRKMYVVISTAVMGVAAVMLAFTTTFEMAMAAALILGLGYGWYLAVDQALITQVLPSAASRGKDLGVINIANSMPQALGPALAAPLVTLSGYPLLFTATAVVTILGALAVLPIRSVP